MTLRPARYTLVLCALLLASSAHAQSIQVRTAADPTRVRPGDAFALTVVVTQWVAGAGDVPEPAIEWPDWKALGIASVSEASRSTTSMPMGNQAMGVTSIVLSLKADKASTIEIPAIAVRGSAGTASTSPLTVTVDPNASAPAPAPAPPAAAPAPPAPQGMPSPPPAATGMPPWWQDPTITQPPQPITPEAPAEDPWERVQYSVGAFLGMVVLLIVILKLSRPTRQ